LRPCREAAKKKKKNCREGATTDLPIPSKRTKKKEGVSCPQQKKRGPLNPSNFHHCGKEEKGEESSVAGSGPSDLYGEA